MATPSANLTGDAQFDWVGASRHALAALVERRLRDADAAEGRIVVGLSGGADSTALLAALAVLHQRRQPAGRPLAVHVHHHLRPDADDDARHAAALAEHLDVEYRQIDIHPGREPGNTAAHARRLRYEALLEAARAADARVIVTGHHANDQAETVLLALARGAGIDGLSGMPLVRPLADEVRLVRPLLQTPRVELELYCTRFGLAFVDDPGNANPDSPRGTMRHRIIPLLDEFFPGAAQRISATSDDLRDLRDWFDGALPWLEPDADAWPREPWRDLRVGVAALIIRRLVARRVPELADRLARRKISPAARAVRDDETRPRRFEFSKTAALVVEAREVRLEYSEPAADSDPWV